MAIARSCLPQLFVVVFAVLFTASESVRFELTSGRTKCISEDIRSNSMTVGKYSIVNPSEGHPLPPSHKIVAKVTSPFTTTYHNAEHVEQGQFAFTAVEAGDYMTCFTAVAHEPETTLTIDFDWRTGVHTKDWTNVAKKGQVEIMETELRKLFDTVSSIHDEMFYLRDREEEMQNLNQATNSKMAWLSFLSLFITLAVAASQFWHLKTFFEKKKLI